MNGSKPHWLYILLVSVGIGASLFAISSLVSQAVDRARTLSVPPLLPLGVALVGIAGGVLITLVALITDDKRWTWLFVLLFDTLPSMVIGLPPEGWWELKLGATPAGQILSSPYVKTLSLAWLGASLVALVRSLVARVRPRV